MSGTSVGALNAALWSSNQLDRGGEIWGSLSQEAAYPYFRPAVLAKVIAPMLVALHITKSWFQGIELSAKVDKWLSFLLCLPMLLAAHLYTAILVTRKHSLESTIFWYCLFMLIWIIWLKRARTNCASRVQILGELFFAAVVTIAGVVLSGTDGSALDKAIFLPPLVVALCSWAFFAVAAFTNRTFLDSRPLKGTIAEVMSGSLAVPTYVTCAVARPVFDPDRPHYVAAHGDTLFTDSRSDPYLLDPIMTFVPRYHCLNELESPERNAALAASAALPLGIVQSDLVRGETCVDGGVIDNTPLVPLVSIEKCEELIVIELSPLNERSCQDERYKMEWKRLIQTR